MALSTIRLLRVQRRRWSERDSNEKKSREQDFAVSLFADFSQHEFFLKRHQTQIFVAHGRQVLPLSSRCATAPLSYAVVKIIGRVRVQRSQYFEWVDTHQTPRAIRRFSKRKFRRRDFDNRVRK